MVKSDTYALESNVHFPTDYNLLRDSGRKSCDVIESMRESGLLQGNWRKLKDWYRKIKNNRRNIGEIRRKGGQNKEVRLKKAVTEYLTIARNFEAKIDGVLNIDLTSEEMLMSLISLEYFKQMLSMHIDLLERRVIKGEKIEHQNSLLLTVRKCGGFKFKG